MPVLMSTPSPAIRSAMMCSRAERLRLRPWLEKMIKEQAIPGLDWIDENAKIVRIPWKHAARHGWSRDKDASLFKEWAIHTKKYDPDTDEPQANPKIWKANFRCAINSLPDIEELKDQGKTKGNDAFKVYRLNPKKPKRSKTVSDSGHAVKKSRNHKSTKTRSRPISTIIPSISSVSSPAQLSIQCSSVNVNVINPPCSQPPPPYESVLRERRETQKRFQLTCGETTIQTRHNLPNNRVLNPIAPFSTLPPFTSNIHHTRTSSIPTPSSTCSSTLSSPVSTVSSPVFTYSHAPFPMQRIPSPEVNVKQELPDYDAMSDSSGDMTDEELVEMVVRMREDSPVNSPSAVVSPTMNIENTCNEWMPCTLDNKQFFSNVVTTNGEPAASTSTYHSAAPSYPSTSHTFFPFPSPLDQAATPPFPSPLDQAATPIKKENTTERPAPCEMQDVSQSCYERSMNNYSN